MHVHVNVMEYQTEVQWDTSGEQFFHSFIINLSYLADELKASVTSTWSCLIDLDN